MNTIPRYLAIALAITIICILVIVGIVLIDNISGPRSIPITQVIIAPPVQILPSRAEWMKLATITSHDQGRTNAMLLQFGNIAVNRTALYQAVGEPSFCQEWKDTTYLVWNCRDGVIRIVANRGMLSYGGQIVGQVTSN